MTGGEQGVGTTGPYVPESAPRPRRPSGDTRHGGPRPFPFATRHGLGLDVIFVAYRGESPAPVSGYRVSRSMVVSVGGEAWRRRGGAGEPRAGA